MNYSRRLLYSETKEAHVIHIHSMEDLVVKMRKTFGNSKNYPSLSWY